MTPIGKFPSSTIRTLAEAAVSGALADASLEPADVDMVFFSNAVAGVVTGQEMIRGQVALRNTGLLGIPIVNVENACASASTAFHLAVMAVRSGQTEVAVAVGSEKLTHDDKQVSFNAIGTAVDLFALEDLRARVNPDLAGEEVPAHSLFMEIYAATARDYMSSSGATETDFAQVAVKSHRFAALNPNAQYRNLVEVEEVLQSRPIAWPLTLLMCSPIGDGAAAVVVCSDEFAAAHGLESVKVAGTALVSGRDRADDSERTAVQRAAAIAYEQAGLGPEDLDVVELHDAAAPAELMAYEELGLARPGEGPALIRSGETALGGRVPVNPSGGLLSKGHPIGATGCAQLVELVDQLRGRCGDRQAVGADVALAENGGGYLGTDAAAAVVTVLTK